MVWHSSFSYIHLWLLTYWYWFCNSIISSLMFLPPELPIYSTSYFKFMLFQIYIYLFFYRFKYIYTYLFYTQIYKMKYIVYLYYVYRSISKYIYATCSVSLTLHTHIPTHTFCFISQGWQFGIGYPIGGLLPREEYFSYSLLMVVSQNLIQEKKYKWFSQIVDLQHNIHPLGRYIDLILHEQWISMYW